MDTANYKILIVDDEPDIIEFLTYNLKKEGFSVASANNGLSAIEIALKIQPHLILLDVMMPEMDGVETCEIIKSKPELRNTIIAFLTARGEDYSQIAGFEAGADDYIAKPIRPKVLISRMKALLKRISTDSETTSNDHIITRGGIVIDKERYLLTKDGETLLLPRKEFELLLLLASKPDKVFTRDEIFSNVWGDDIIVGDRTIDVHIRKLREKIGMEHFQTVKGVGYKFIL